MEEDAVLLDLMPIIPPLMEQLVLAAAVAALLKELATNLSLIHI